MKPAAFAARLSDATKVFARDAGRGLLLVTHNGLAVLGLAAAGALAVIAPSEWRSQAEHQVYAWLHLRHGTGPTVALATPGELVVEQAEPMAGPSADAVAQAYDVPPLARATAVDPAELTRPQAAVATWISRRYKVALEPIGRIVQEAWEVGRQYGVEPTLILAIMAIESSFNPFAQSQVGAQGLMQVMTKVHDKKYEAFGGAHAAFDPVTNLRVGVEVLKECISRAGGVYDGLRHYVGAANLPSDGGYAGKVLGEHQNLKKIAAGVAVPHTVRIVPVPAPIKAPEPGPDGTPADTKEAAVAEPGMRLSGLASEPTP